MKTFPFSLVLHTLLAGSLTTVIPFAAVTDSLLHFRYAKPFRTALQLPATGPGAALTNPARMAESGCGLFILDKGKAGNVSTYAGHGDFALASRRVYLGFGFLLLGESNSVTSALYLDHSLQTQLAYRHAFGEEGAFWSVGYAIVLRHLNAYGDWKISPFTHDIGVILEPAPIYGLHANASLVFHDLVPTEVTVPRGEFNSITKETYTLYQWSSDATLALASPGRLIATHAVLTAFSRNESPYPGSGPLREGWGPNAFRMALNRYGLELNATSWASLRAERLWNRYWSLGATLRLDPWLSRKLEADGGFTTGPMLENMRSERSGLHYHFGIRVGL